ncbi:hypothetical protein K503DRAFT_356214 [Rhizopogon vinicolor AM-OR11-026]|uniref:Uncharacterized protein n=1 Tax=Rhizopogon vinicolor AM-OR11-026 TaxID=1314800 RepID=A0A1B7NCC3_9AGAM|nr:hypothetical protein K503DRAFT_356214 [Rhizopogon vinicolor AM-OR11-026]
MYYYDPESWNKLWEMQVLSRRTSLTEMVGTSGQIVWLMIWSATTLYELEHALNCLLRFCILYVRLYGFPSKMFHVVLVPRVESHSFNRSFRQADLLVLPLAMSHEPTSTWLKLKHNLTHVGFRADIVM